jgi:hypothetical protein
MRRWLAVLVWAAGAFGAGPKFYDDDPLLAEPAPRDASRAVRRKLSDYYDFFHHTFATPGDRRAIPALGVNTLGDPMDGAWYERRHYWRRMSIEELQRGPIRTGPPSRSARWKVVGVKNEGVTPGFQIRDSANRLYFVKFDPLCCAEMATAADQIANKLLYALGYHVPENHIVYFTRDDLELAPGVQIEDALGRKRPVSSRDISEILLKVPRDSQGRYRATASLALPGKPLGPYRYYGTRSDDPNDTVPHEHRRDLRALHVASAWIDHDDSRAINTLDVLEDWKGVKYIKHYQLDLGSTLGSGSTKMNSARSGGEYLFAWKPAAVQFFTLGLHVPWWARAHFPNMPSVGRFESKVFDPDKWAPEYPNPAFLNRLPDDEFWMAKQIVNITDEEIRAIVRTGELSDPKAEQYLAACLIERRDKIGRAAFAKVLPLDRFRIEGGVLRWSDLAQEHGYGGVGPVQLRWHRFDNASGQATPWDAALRDWPRGYWMAELSASRRPSQRVRVYVRSDGASPRIVGVEHQWRNPAP